MCVCQIPFYTVSEMIYTTSLKPLGREGAAWEEPAALAPPGTLGSDFETTISLLSYNRPGWRLSCWILQ